MLQRLLLNAPAPVPAPPPRTAMLQPLLPGTLTQAPRPCPILAHRDDYDSVFFLLQILSRGDQAAS